jgi:hypothetical protein
VLARSTQEAIVVNLPSLRGDAQAATPNTATPNKVGGHPQ